MAAQYIVTKRNFDFHKLLDNIPKILDKGTKRLGRSAAKGAKERISKGLKPRLKASTLQLRRERGTGGTKPLFETGSLFRSIKANDEGFIFNAAVNVEEELVEMLEASRQYQNNIEVVSTLRNLMMRTINMGK